MKLNISTTFFTTLFLLSTTVTISHLPSTTADYVYDTDGFPMQNGGMYYMMPVSYGIGGVTVAKTGNETCPLSVVLSSDEHSRGSAVRISSPLRVANIYEGLNLDMSFTSSMPACAPARAIWSVVKGPQEIVSIKLRGIDEYGVDDSIVPGWFSVGRRRGGNIVRFCGDGSERCEDVVESVDENGVTSLSLGYGARFEHDDRKTKKSVFAVRFLRARRHHHHNVADE